MIILVQINYTKDRSEAILPLGILAVGSALKRHGHLVELVNINENQLNTAAEYIIKKNPLCVGFSVMTGVQTEHSARLSKLIKQQSEIPVVWGGIHPSLLPRQCLASDYIDYVVVGEGEETMVELAEKIKSKASLDSVLGLGFKGDGKIFINQDRPLIENLDDYPLDYSLVHLEKYIFKLDKFKRVIAYKSSRGCPYDCAFCYNLEFNRRRYRAKSAEAVIGEIKWLRDKYQIEAVKFYDDNFFADKQRAFTILEGIGLPAHTEIRIDAIDEETAQKLKRLKSFDLLIGMESGSDRILELINKKITVADILQAVKILAKYDLTASYSTMVGLPTETKKEFWATIDLMYQSYKLHPKARFTLGAFLPYPGSKLYALAVEKGFVPPEKTEDWGKMDRFRDKVISPWVNAKYVWRIRECFKFLSMNLGPVKEWLKWRIRHHFFALPLDIYALEYLSHLAISERGLFGKMMRKAYNLIRR